MTVDDRKFDALTRTFASTKSRRGALRTLIGGGLAGIFAVQGLSSRPALALPVCGTSQTCLTNMQTDITSVTQPPATPALVTSLKTYVTGSQFWLTNGNPAARGDVICNQMTLFVAAVGAAAHSGKLSNADAARLVDDANAVRGTLTTARGCAALPYPAGVISCASGQTVCSGVCVDTLFDHNNCGTCGTVCSGINSCCSGQCADTIHDSNNCGSCGTVCAQNQVCVAGVCIQAGT